MGTIIKNASLLVFLLFFSASILGFDKEKDQNQDLEQEIKDMKERLEALEEIVKEKESEPELRVFYKKGLRFESADGSFSAKINGKIHVDWGWMSGEKDLDDYLSARGDDLEDRVEFRRARLAMSGRMYDRFVFRADYNFAGIDSEFKYVYFGVDELPLESELRMGLFKEPFSLVSTTSVYGLRFLERSLVYAITPRRNTGLGWLGTFFDGRMSWGVGTFYNTNSFGDGGGDGDLSVTARMTGLPWYEGDDGLLHLGLSYSFRGEDELSFSTEPETKVAPDFIETEDIRVDAANLFGGETAVILGPFSAQAEYILMKIQAPVGSNPTLSGSYLEAGYFLTGEQRAYRKKYGYFGRVTPESNFLSDEGGTGAWEVAARYSRLDLADSGILYGGKMADYTLGLNWYLNPSVRITANYIHSHLNQVGSARIFAIRFAFNF